MEIDAGGLKVPCLRPSVNRSQDKNLSVHLFKQ
jgi:hypothetical protein